MNWYSIVINICWFWFDEFNSILLIIVKILEVWNFWKVCEKSERWQHWCKLRFILVRIISWERFAQKFSHIDSYDVFQGRFAAFSAESIFLSPSYLDIAPVVMAKLMKLRPPNFQIFLTPTKRWWERDLVQTHTEAYFVELRQSNYSEATNKTRSVLDEVYNLKRN